MTCTEHALAMYFLRHPHFKAHRKSNQRLLRLEKFAIPEHASAHRAYIMFRTLGLRHLVVVNHYNEVMGMITRENLLPEHFVAGGAYMHSIQDKIMEKMSSA